MKLLLFLVIIIIIYFVMTKINVIHVDSLPPKQRDELNHKNKIKNMLLTNYIMFDDEQQNYEPKKNKFQENFSQMIDKSKINLRKKFNQQNQNYLMPLELLNKIKSEYLDRRHQFNFANLPVTTRYPNKNTFDQDKKYLKHITNNINEWNYIFGSNKKMIVLKDIKPIFIMETSDEFWIKANVQLLYQKKTLHLQLTYFGQIEKSDDFLNGGNDVYILQLVAMKPISKTEFDQTIKSANENTGEFMTMDEQLAYVDKINKIHNNEDSYY